MLTVINLNEFDKWDSIVRSFENYDVYYLPGYTKAFKLHGDGEPTLVYFQNQEMRAINVVMIRDIEKDINFKGKINSNNIFDIITPYGYGGFILEGTINEKNLDIMNLEYSNFCNSRNIVSEFTRFHPIISNSDINNRIYKIVDLGKTITMDLISKEQIWNGLSSKNRNVIRKAIKSGVKIFWGRYPSLIDEFVPLYNSIMDKDKAADYYYFNVDFYKSMLEDLKYNSLVFYASYDKKIISMAYIIFANNKMHYHLSASDRKYQHLAATNLLLYETACWGCENGYKSFHLGGGLGSEEDNLYKFKKAFNKNSETRFSIGKKIFNQKKYKELMEIRAYDVLDENKRDFFPEYRR
ncbi:GNAT family N-acetyltransferase [Mycoplasmatota bacterium WC30]